MDRMLFIRRRGIIIGPFTWTRVAEMVHAGTLTAAEQLSADKRQWHDAAEYFPRELAVPEPMPDIPMAVAEEQIPEADVQTEETAETQATGENSEAGEEIPLKFAAQDPIAAREGRLWLVCHLCCALGHWRRHSVVLAGYVRQANWMATGYSVLAVMLPMVCFCQGYPAAGGMLRSCCMALVTLAASASISFLTVAWCLNHTRSHEWKVGSLAAMGLLMLLSTAIGTDVALLQGLVHYGAVVRLFVGLLMLFDNALLAVCSLQLILGFAHGQLAFTGRRSFQIWLLWMLAALLPFSFLNVFLIGF